MTPYRRIGIFISKSFLLLSIYSLVFFLTCLPGNANNLKIWDVAVSNVTGSNVQNISFKISWDNSWSLASGVGAANHDAAWIFIKYQNASNGTWAHAKLSSTSADHTADSGAIVTVDAVSDGGGVFIRRSSSANPGNIGSIPTTAITLKLNTALNVSGNFQVFGIEMVNIPAGEFYIGDGTRGSHSFGFGGTNGLPVLITSQMQSTSGLAASLYTLNGNYGVTLPTSYPMGVNAFYCMKYEIAQIQYVGFLNTLTYEQQLNRTSRPPNSSVSGIACLPYTGVSSPCRNGIKIKVSGTNNNVPAEYGCNLDGDGVFNEVEGDGLNIACNWLSWSDLTAYLDWAALRPMTEFEYEKTCRGPSSLGAPSPSEYPWGTTSMTIAKSNSLSNRNGSNELSTASGNGLCATGAVNNTDTLYGPLRSGFAATGNVNRIQAGSTYYGVMDMAGNVGDQQLSAYGYYNTTAALFSTTPGDGELNGSGNANTVYWPTYLGSTSRGGDWYTSGYSQTSDRFFMNQFLGHSRDYRYGGRGVR